MVSEESSENPISRGEVELRDGRVRFEWTRSGLIFAGLAVALFGVGMWRVDGEMAAMGLAAGILLLIVWRIGKGNLREMSIVYRGPRRVQAGQGFDAGIEIVSKRRFLDGFWIEFGVTLNREMGLSGQVSWLEAEGSAFVSRRISLKKRGRQFEQRGWVRSTFPLGLMKFEKMVAVDAEIGVLPGNKTPDEVRFSGFLNEGPQIGNSRQFGGMGEWKGLTEWRSGDPVKKIAWAASLRSEMSGGGLLVRRYEPPGSQVESCVVVFHSLGGEGNLIRPDRFEMALSLLSGVTSFLRGWGIPVEVRADFRDWERLEIRTKRQLAAFKEEMIFAERAGWTEVHDLRVAFGDIRKNQCLVVLSDMPARSCAGLLPQLPLAPVVIDIESYHGGKRRQFLKRKEVGK